MPEVELYLPVGVRMSGQRAATPQTRNAAAVLTGEGDIGDFTAAMGGRTAKPRKPVVIWAPDGRSQIILLGAGYAEAAQLEDMAHEAFAEARETMKRNKGRAFDAEDARERAGVAPLDQAGVMMAEALAERSRRHKANPVTDPAPQERRNPSPVGKTVHSTAASQDWKGK